MCKLEVKINQTEKTYPIFISHKDITILSSEILDFTGNSNYIVVISKKVFDIYSKQIQFDKNKIFVLKDGENEKNIHNYAKIMKFVLSKGLTRGGTIVAVGGGVVGDLAGFVASTYMRGINYIQVPTTLLAATDSSVGGKTAINSRYGKNLIGSFYQPSAVFININFLKTLDQYQFKSGLGEILKYGFIEKSCLCEQELNLLNFLAKNYSEILSRDVLILCELIEMCIKLKISVVTKDEKESDLRRILNFGHSYAHALETLTKYKKYTHGHCVVAGMLFAFDLALRLGKIDKEYYFLCDDLIKKFEFSNINGFSQKKIMSVMKSDKKIKNGKLAFIMPDNYAHVSICEMDLEEVVNEKV